MAVDWARYLDPRADKPIRLTAVDWLLGVAMYGVTIALAVLVPWARDIMDWVLGGGTGLGLAAGLFPFLTTAFGVYSWQYPTWAGGPLLVQLTRFIPTAVFTSICFALGLHIGRRGVLGLALHGLPPQGHLSVATPWFQLVGGGSMVLYTQVWSTVRAIVYPAGASRCASASES